jgi:hypothetical protein
VTTRPLVVALDVDDLERLRFIARRRDVDPGELGGHLITTWIAGPGQRELLAAVAGEPVSTGNPVKKERRRRTPKPAGVPGQLALVDEDYPPF